MLLYAQDAQTTDKPWELWQRDLHSYSNWVDLHESPMWRDDTEYRRKQKYITVGNIEVPEPLRAAPPINTTYWYFHGSSVAKDCWYTNNNRVDALRLDSGIIHLTYEAARKHSTAITALNNQPGH